MTPSEHRETPSGTQSLSLPFTAIYGSSGSESGSNERDADALTESVVKVSWKSSPATLDAALAALVRTLHRENPRWMRHAACKTTTGVDWHTDTQRRGRDTRAAVEAMKAVCTDCPVLGACTTWTLDDTSTDRLPGVVAGLDITERRSRRRAAATLRRATATATKGRTNAPS
jgi:hypothetical protein